MLLFSEKKLCEKGSRLKMFTSSEHWKTFLFFLTFLQDYLKDVKLLSATWFSGISTWALSFQSEQMLPSLPPMWINELSSNWRY